MRPTTWTATSTGAHDAASGGSCWRPGGTSGEPAAAGRADRGAGAVAAPGRVAVWAASRVPAAAGRVVADLGRLHRRRPLSAPDDGAAPDQGATGRTALGLDRAPSPGAGAASSAGVDAARQSRVLQPASAVREPPVRPFYDDGTVTIWCADLREVPLSELVETAACVVTSPPYNVGLDYDADPGGDRLAWDAYWRLADTASDLMARSVVSGGRVWVNTAVSVPETPAPAREGPGKRRVLLARGWADALEPGGHLVL